MRNPRDFPSISWLGCFFWRSQLNSREITLLVQSCFLTWIVLDTLCVIYHIVCSILILHVSPGKKFTNSKKIGDTTLTETRCRCRPMFPSICGRRIYSYPCFLLTVEAIYSYVEKFFFGYIHQELMTIVNNKSQDNLIRNSAVNSHINKS